MTTWAEIGVADPTPGDVGTLRDWAARCQEIAGQSREATRRLAAVGPAGWSGSGASRFEEILAQTLPEILSVATAHDQAASAMRGYADSLASYQELAARLLARYTAARQQAESAAAEGRRRCREQDTCTSDRLATRARLVTAQAVAALDGGQEAARWSHRLTELDTSHARLGAAIATARSQESAARTEMERIRTDAHNLARYRQDAAYAAARAIAAAVGAKLMSRNPVVRAGQVSVAATRTAISSDVFDTFVQSLTDTADMVSLAAMVVQVIPFIGQAVGGAMFVAAKVMTCAAFAGMLLRTLNGDEPWSALGGSALSLGVTLILPSAFSRATKPATLASSAKRIATTRGTALGRTLDTVSGDFGLGYIKQGLRPGKAGGRWAGPIGKFIEKNVHVVPVLDQALVPASRARYYFLTAGALTFGTAVYDKVQTAKDLGEKAEDLVGWVSSKFDDDDEQVH